MCQNLSEVRVESISFHVVVKEAYATISLSRGIKTLIHVLFAGREKHEASKSNIN